MVRPRPMASPASLHTKLLVALGVPALVLISVGWYWSENFSGRVPEWQSKIGHVIVYPGWFAELVMTYSLGGFGDWRTPVVEIGVTWLVWYGAVRLACLVLVPEVYRRFHKEPLQACAICGYDLAGLPTDVCPECGSRGDSADRG